MKLLHRYIFTSVALTSLAAVAVLTSIVTLGSVLKDLLPSVLAGQLPPEMFLRLINLTVQFSICYTLPGGVLTGVLLVLGRMSADREITAIRSSGVSIAGISAPIFSFALIGTALSLAVNFHYMPRAKVAYEQEFADAVRSNPLSFLVPKTFIRQFSDKIVFVGENHNLQLRDVWIWDLDKQARAIAVNHAERADLVYDEKNNSLQLTGYNVTVETRDPKDPEKFGEGFKGFTAHSEVLTQTFSLEKMIGVPQQKLKQEWMTFDQLMTERQRLLKPDPKVTLLKRDQQRIMIQTVIQKKAAMAFSVLSFALIAIPLGIKVSRKETSANLGIALALAMGFYLLTVAIQGLEQKPEFRPDLLMWLPNLGFQALGIFMFYKADRS
jgi:lipopolysaccharide export system permease protein